jgi:hypothetical protein
MNKKSLIKFAYKNEKGLFHYVIFNKDLVVLSEVNTGKIAHIEEFGTLDVTFDIKEGVLEPLKAEVVKDKEYVEQVYNYMIETNNAYFTEGFDNLCVIKFYK